MAKKQSKNAIKENVISLLRDNEQARNSDKHLIFLYWRNIDNVKFNNESEFYQAFVKQATSTESIRRARQIVQEDGLYLPTDATVLARRWKKAEMKSAIIKEREVVALA